MIEAIWAPWLTREATTAERGRPGTAGTGGDGDREGLGALVVRASTAELPAAGGVEGLVEDLRRPRLAERSQVDRADREGVGGAGAALGAPTTAARIRSKPPLAGALGASSLTMLPVWAVASSVRVASWAFTGIASVPGACRLVASYWVR
jgi:hypothetical protein